MTDSKPLHQCVHEHVTAKGLTIAEIAQATGWSEQRVYRLLTGRTELSAGDMLVFAKLVAKPVAALYRGAA